MGVRLTKTFSGLNGATAVDPNAVIFVTGGPAICQLHLLGGIAISVFGDPDEIATALWGYTNKTDNGFYNLNLAIAVTATDPDHCRVHFTSDDFADINMSVEMFMETSRAAEAYRAELDRKFAAGVKAKPFPA